MRERPNDSSSTRASGQKAALVVQVCARRRRETDDARFAARRLPRLPRRSLDHAHHRRHARHRHWCERGSARARLRHPPQTAALSRAVPAVRHRRGDAAFTARLVVGCAADRGLDRRLRAGAARPSRAWRATGREGGIRERQPVRGARPRARESRGRSGRRESRRCVRERADGADPRRRTGVARRAVRLGRRAHASDRRGPPGGSCVSCGGDRAVDSGERGAAGHDQGPGGRTLVQARRPDQARSQRSAVRRRRDPRSGPAQHRRRPAPSTPGAQTRCREIHS